MKPRLHDAPTHTGAPASVLTALVMTAIGSLLLWVLIGIAVLALI